MGTRYGVGELVRDKFTQDNATSVDDYDLVPLNERLPVLKEKLLECMDALVIHDEAEFVADLLEVLEEYCKHWGFDWQEVLQMQESMRNSDGGYQNGVLLKKNQSL